MRDEDKVRTTIRQMRALVQDGRERICPLRPAWGVHLADEALCRLRDAIDSLEDELGLAPCSPASAQTRSAGSTGLGDARR